MYSYNPCVEIDSKGNAHFTWYGYIETTKLAYNIGYRVHWAGNDTWSNIIPLTSETSYYKYGSVLSVDANDDVHVIWDGTSAERPGSNIMYKMFDSSANSWQPIEYLTNTTYQYDTTIGFNKKGEVDALWYGYQLPGLEYPYAIHHAQKTTMGWTEDYNFIRTSTYNYYPNMMSSPPNSIADEGFAFVWYDGSVRYWTSRDFRMGNPEYLNGLDWCNGTVLVKNVEPKLNLTALSTMGHAYEQSEYELIIFFEDPAIGVPTEIFETKIDWGDGTEDDWTVGKSYPVQSLLKGRNPEVGIAANVLKEEYSFQDKPITYISFEYIQPSYPYYWYINIEGYNMSTNAWEQLFYHYDFYGPSGPYEQNWTTPYYTRWRVEASCYQYAQYTGYYEFEYMVEDFNLTGGYVIATHMYRDDMPTGTPWDINNISIELREDDLGYDKGEAWVTVSTVAPTLEEGDFNPDLVDYMDEGTVVSMEYFQFDDVAFDEPTETFQYEVDWGDGSPTTGWNDDFVIAGKGGEVFTVKKDNQVSSMAVYPSSSRNLVMDSKGNLYAVTVMRPGLGGSYEIFCSVSDDLGETWEHYEISSDSRFSGNTQYYPTVAIDSKDILHVAWSSYDPSSYYSLYYINSTDGGKTWGNLTLILKGKYIYNYPYNVNYTYNYQPAIAVDYNDVVHIAWQYQSYDYNYVTYVYKYTFAIKYVNNLGGKWSVPINVTYWSGTTSPYRYQYQPSIAIDSMNNVHVSWYGYNPWRTTYNIRYRKFNQTTDAWEPIYEVTNGTSYQYYPCIVTDIYDNVHIVWRSGSYPYPVRYIKYDESTQTWGSVQSLSGSIPYCYYASIGTDQRGNLYVAFTGYRWTGSGYSYPYGIWMVEDTGSGFGTPYMVVGGGEYGYQYYPSVMGHAPNCYSIRGAALVWSGQKGTYDTFFYATDDWFIGHGPLKGIPPMEHLYSDDNPTATKRDEYELTIRVRDDDTAMVEYNTIVKVRNVLPEVTSTVELASGEENKLMLPAIDFMDPGTGPNEKWHYWWDINNNGYLDSWDVTGSVADSDVTVIDNVSYGRTPEVLATINDDYRGDAEIWVYDDDTPLDMQYKGTIYLPGFDVTDATFEAYQYGNNWESIDWSTMYTGGAMTYAKDMSVYQNLAMWNERGINWTNYAPSTSNLNYVPEDTLTVDDRKALGISGHYPAAGGSNHWEPFEITSLTEKWLEGTAKNYGISIMPTLDNKTMVVWDHTVYYSSGKPAEVPAAYKPKLTISVDEDEDGIADSVYVLQPSDGDDAWIAQCSLNLSYERWSGVDQYLLPNLVDSRPTSAGGLGYKSVGSFYRRGVIQFDLSSVSWRGENEVVWPDPPMNHTISVVTTNVPPEIRVPDVINVLPFEEVIVEFELYDQGSDDLYMCYDWGDDDTYTWPGPSLPEHNNLG
jgi:hypothetical protein